MATLLQEAGRLFTSKLRSQGTPIETTSEDFQRMLRSRKLYDYYYFDRDKILQYVTEAMRGTFKVQTMEKMQFPFFNLTRKIIDRLAVAYLEPAERYVIVPEARRTDGTETLKAKDLLASKDNELYQRILHGSNINSAAKLWNRLAKLLDTVYVFVAYRDGRIEYDVLPPHALTVIPSRDNYLEPEEIRYDRAFGDKTHTVVWRADAHKIVDSNGVMVEGLNPWGGVNNYGVIPAAPCRLRYTDDHWGDGDTELVYMNEKVNILIASWFFNLVMQSHGQAVSINMNLPEEFSIGPDYVIEANGVEKDDVVPDFRYVHPDPATSDNIKAIDWMIKTAAVMKGISAQSINTEISDRQSGVAKEVDLAELREHRRDDVEFLRPFEKRLFDITRTVWNANEKERLSEKATFGIDFVDPEMPVSPMDEIIIKEKKMALGLWSPVLDYMDEDEAIDENQALADVLKNIQWNKQIVKARGDAG